MYRNAVIGKENLAIKRNTFASPMLESLNCVPEHSERPMIETLIVYLQVLVPYMCLT